MTGKNKPSVKWLSFWALIVLISGSHPLHASPSIPTCPQGQVLQMDGPMSFSCTTPTQSSVVPKCEGGQVLAMGADQTFTCSDAPPRQEVPTCSKGQALEFDASGVFNCSNIDVQARIPSCPKGQELEMVTTDVFSCFTETPVVLPKCAKGDAIWMTFDGKVVCGAVPECPSSQTPSIQADGSLVCQ